MCSVTEWRALLALAISASCTSRAALLSNPSRAVARSSWKGPRLPSTVRPEAYRLDLRVIPPRDIDGVVEIDVNVLRPTDVIYLNARGLERVAGSLSAHGEEAPLQIVAVSRRILALVAPVAVHGRVTLRLRFRAPLSTRMERGTFLRWNDGRYYVYTQFEPTWARRAFPCFDEPGLKATWQVTIRIRPDQDAFSNTPQIAERMEGGLKVVTFKKTPPLPPYLIAFAVGKFAVTDLGRTARGVPVRVLEPISLRRGRTLARNGVIYWIHRAESYLGVAFPFEKLDLVIVPRWEGAMENAGLITIGAEREDDHTIAHEVAHQWFGDLVTGEWWTDIWLHEAFATWFTEKLAGSTRYGDGEYALLHDPGSVLDPVFEDDDVRFPAAYGKGSSILRTVEAWIGPEAFQSAVRSYLVRHAWKTATTDDFLRTMPRAAPVLRSLLSRSSSPIVAVELDCSVTPSRLVVRQLGTPFAFPLCFRSESDSACQVIEEAEASVAVGTSCPAWIAPNRDARGFYSVVPGPKLRSLLASSDRLTDKERRRLGYDLLRAVRERVLPLGDALAMVEGLVRPSDRDLAVTWFHYIEAVVPDDLRPAFTYFLQRAFAKVDLDDWSAKDADLARAIADPGVRDEAKLRWQAWRQGGRDQPIAWVIPLAVADGDRALFDRLRAELAADPKAHELARAIGSFRDPGLAQAALDLIGGEIQDRLSVAELLDGMARTPETRALARRYLLERDSPPFRAKQDTIGWLLWKICDEPTLEETRAWVSKTYGAFPGPDLTEAERCIVLRKYHEPSLRTFLAP